MFFIFLTINTHVKCHTNLILFTIQLRNLFLCIILNYKNLKFEHLIDDIVIDFWFSKNFTSMKDVRKKRNPIMDSSKFTYNMEILSGVVDKLCLYFYK